MMDSTPQNYLIRLHFGGEWRQPQYCDNNIVDTTIKELGGKSLIKRIFNGPKGIDEDTKTCSFWFNEYEFPRSSLKVFLTGELWPHDVGKGIRSETRIRIRLGNYNVKDYLAKKVGDKLLELHNKYSEGLA